jgi:ketosteroid isomerase-like protein
MMATGRKVDLETRVAIQDLVTEHSHLVDHGHADRLADLYTEDGELIGLPPANLLGRRAIREWGEQRVLLTTRTSRHIESNLRVFWDGNVLRGTLSVVMFRSDTEDVSDTRPKMVGDYEDEFARDGDRWRIRRRIIRRAFAASVLVAQPELDGERESG